MSNLKAKLAAKKATQAQTEREPSELFINLGLPIEIEGKEVFVNLPLTLTADRLEDVIEKQVKLINPNSPNSWVELIEGRILIAEAVKTLFSKLEAGESVNNKEIDPENEDFGFLSDLQVQFTRRKEQVEVETGNARQSVLDKFRKAK